MENDPLKINGMHDGALPEIFRNAEKLRAKMTDTEELIWELLKSKPLGYKFRRQHPLNKYILDFYCHRKRISIEIDGAYHTTLDQKVKDAERTAYLISVGVKEIRFTNEVVLENLPDVKLQILKELRETCPRD